MEEYTSGPQGNSSQSPLQKWQSGIAVLPQRWPRTQGMGETWRAPHPLNTLYKIYGSLQEHNTNSTLSPCSPQDPFVETCLQPPLASKNLHLLLLNIKACSYSTPCLASFAWHPWTHPLGSAFFHFHWMPNLWYVSELITGDKHGAEIREKRPCSQVFWHQEHVFGASDLCSLTSHTPVLQQHQCSMLISFQGEVHCGQAGHLQNMLHCNAGSRPA